MKKWILKPSQNTQGRVELCGMDLIGGLGHIPALWFFDSTLDPERFREALAKAIEYYPMYGGKIVEESGRLFVDYDGHGVHFEYMESDAPCPQHGPDVFPFDATGLIPRTIVTPDRSGSVLYSSRLTRFADGRYIYATCESHLLRDGAGLACFTQDLNDIYMDRLIEPPVTDRAALIETADLSAERLSDVAGSIDMTQPSQRVADVFIAPELGSVMLPSEGRRRLVETAKSIDPVRGSFNKLFHALLFRAHTMSRQNPAQKLHANLMLDVRRVKGIAIPDRYFGGATLQRTVEIPLRDALNGPWPDLYQCFNDPGLSNPASVAQDMGFMQQCYLKRRFNALYSLMDYIPPTANGGLLINNATHLPNAALRFEGLATWTESILTDRIKIRMAKPMPPDSHGNMAVRLVLPKHEMDRFEACWKECLADLAEL